MSEREKWTLNTGLDYIFENLEEDSILYIDVIKEYFNENAPLRINGYRQIKYLIDNLGYQATYDLVINKMFDKKMSGYHLFGSAFRKRVSAKRLLMIIKNLY